MGWVDKLVGKFVKTASITVTETVKTEAKNAASSILPILIGVVGAIAGVRMYRSSSVQAPKVKRLPTMSTTTTTTNNFFFGEDMAREAFDRAVKK